MSKWAQLLPKLHAACLCPSLSSHADVPNVAQALTRVSSIPSKPLYERLPAAEC